MTEFQCSCHIEGESYSLLTCGAVTTTQAFEQFRDYIESELIVPFDIADGLIIDRVEVER